MLQGAPRPARSCVWRRAYRRIVAAKSKRRLVSVRRLRVGPVEGQADAGEQPERSPRSVEGARLDEGLDDAAVDAATVDAGAKSTGW